MSQISSTDLDQFEQMIQEKKFAEAKVALEAYLDKDLTSIEKGEIYTQLASVYLKVSHTINQQYIKKLDETLELLEQTNKAERKTDDTLNLAQVKLNLTKDSE